MNPDSQAYIKSLKDKQVSGDHYVKMEVQPWDVMEVLLTHEEFIGYLKGNIIKYSMRQGRKEGSDDAGKAKHYMEKLAATLARSVDIAKQLKPGHLIHRPMPIP